jgi:hypothetical protein
MSMNLAAALSATPETLTIGAERTRTVTLAGGRISKTQEGKPALLLLEKQGDGAIIPVAKFLADDTPLGGTSKFATAKERLKAMLEPLDGVLTESGIDLGKLQNRKVQVLEGVQETQDGTGLRWRTNWISPVLAPETGIMAF